MNNKNNNNKIFKIEYKLPDELFEDDFDKIKEFAEKSMNKIVSFSNYNLLKIVMKTHGNTIGTHKVKYDVNITLSEGNKILHVDKEILPKNSDEIKSDKNQVKWNIPLLVQEALISLENKVVSIKEK